MRDTICNVVGSTVMYGNHNNTAHSTKGQTIAQSSGAIANVSILYHPQDLKIE